jgi:phage tail protein X
MANSKEITEILENKIVNKYVYRGNVQAITVSLTDAATGLVQIADVLPPNTRIVFADLTASAGNITQLGTTADADAYISGKTSDRLILPHHAAGGANGYIEVGGDDLAITLSESATVRGVVLIVGNE